VIRVLINNEGFTKITKRAEPASSSYISYARPLGDPSAIDVLDATATAYEQQTFWRMSLRSAQGWPITHIEVFSEGFLTDLEVADILYDLNLLEKPVYKPTKLEMENTFRRAVLGVQKFHLSRKLDAGEESVALDIYEESGMQAAKDWLEGK